MMSSSASSKRPAGLAGLLSQSAQEAKRTASDRPPASSSSSSSSQQTNPLLSRPTQPEDAIRIFLIQVRGMSKRRSLGNNNPSSGGNSNCVNVEIEARLGTLISPSFIGGGPSMRALSSGAKVVNVGGKDRIVRAFITKISDDGGNNNGGQSNTTTTNFEGGITRSNYLKWTSSGLSEYSPLSASFSCAKSSSSSSSNSSSTANNNNVEQSEGSILRSQLIETETVTTSYAYPDRTRINFIHDPQTGLPSVGAIEKKEKLSTMDMALPGAPYDLRLTCATEISVNNNNNNSSISSSSNRGDDIISDVTKLPPGWTSRRLKRRRSYIRGDGSFAWRMDVTEVSTSENNNNNHHHRQQQQQQQNDSHLGYEIEMELSTNMTNKFLNPQLDDNSARKLADTLSQQLWYMIQQLNPTQDVLEVSEFLREHANTEATKLAIGQCGAIRKYVDSGWKSWRSAISPDNNNNGGPNIDNIGGVSCDPPRNFVGCMPVNFSRHNIEDIQRSSTNGYYLSEKTDGVRYILVCTGSSIVLVDRASHESKKAYQPKPRGDNGNNIEDPMHALALSIKPGAVLDGEVVVHRRLRRPVFIVFDVLANSANEPILHLPFEQRLRHLRSASFMKGGKGGGEGNNSSGIMVDVFDPAAVSDLSIALPLVRKNFVDRIDLDRLLSYVTEERGMRTYKYGDTHHHLTDGIIFQPNSPYVCGTDVNLLKWKYLDTVTIDVEILPPRNNNFGNRNNGGGSDADDVLRVGVMGEEGTSVDMTRYLRLPDSERRRLEADRHESGSRIAEVGFDPGTGEWYYRTMRPDKVAPNHISTVLGTLLELAESLSTEELRYRMIVPSGTRDTYARDVRHMQKQLLEHQRRKNQATSGSK